MKKHIIEEAHPGDHFKHFLKSLKQEYFENTCVYDQEIRDYLDSTKLWHHQFLYVHYIKSGKFYHKGFDTALGYSIDHLTADFFVRSIHPNDLPMYFSISKALLSFVLDNSSYLIPFESSFNVNYRVKKQNGHYISVLRQSTPLIKNANGKVEAYVSLCSDITNITEDHRVKWQIYGPRSEQFPVYLRKSLPSSETENIFSERELNILKLLSEGCSTAEISQRLFISHNTVNTHRKNIMRKANVNKTIDLLFFAKDNGYL